MAIMRIGAAQQAGALRGDGASIGGAYVGGNVGAGRRRAAGPQPAGGAVGGNVGAGVGAGIGTVPTVRPSTGGGVGVKITGSGSGRGGAGTGAGTGGGAVGGNVGSGSGSGGSTGGNVLNPNNPSPVVASTGVNPMESTAFDQWSKYNKGLASGTNDEITRELSRARDDISVGMAKEGEAALGRNADPSLFTSRMAAAGQRSLGELQGQLAGVALDKRNAALTGLSGAAGQATQDQNNLHLGTMAQRLGDQRLILDAADAKQRTQDAQYERLIQMMQTWGGNSGGSWGGTGGVGGGGIGGGGSSFFGGGAYPTGGGGGGGGFALGGGATPRPPGFGTPRVGQAPRPGTHF